MTHGDNIATNGRIDVPQGFPPVMIASELDGGKSRVVLQGFEGRPDDIQVDDPGHAIDWTSMGARPASKEVFPDADGTIERCDLGGQDQEVLVGNGKIATPKQMQLDATGRLIYWCGGDGMAILRCRRWSRPDHACAHRSMAFRLRKCAASLCRDGARCPERTPRLAAGGPSRWRSRSPSRNGIERADGCDARRSSRPGIVSRPSDRTYRPGNRS